jgi:hypothetical protein
LITGLLSWWVLPASGPDKNWIVPAIGGPFTASIEELPNMTASTISGPLADFVIQSQTFRETDKSFSTRFFEMTAKKSAIFSLSFQKNRAEKDLSVIPESLG